MNSTRVHAFLRFKPVALLTLVLRPCFRSHLMRRRKAHCSAER